MGKFAHLHTHSHYSLLDGLSKIPELVKRTKELGMDALAVTDHGVLYGAVEFYQTATKAGVKPIFGVEAYVAPGNCHDRNPGEKYHHLILLAENKTGWHNLIKIVTRAHLEGFYYKPRCDRDILHEFHEGLIATSACVGGEVNFALLQGDVEKAERLAREYEDIFGKGNFFLEIQHHANIKEAMTVRERAIALSRKTGISLVAAQDSHYTLPEQAEYHDILLAVQTQNRVADDDRLTMKDDDFSLKSPEQMAEEFKDVPEAIANTAKIAERCSVDLELGKIRLPNFPKPKGKTGDEHLRELVDERIAMRFPKDKQTPEVRERLTYELDVIKKTGFADYFLIVQDIVNWAKSRGIAVGPGRGSAPSSIVSYILGITDVNPIHYNLLFERFLNPERNEMPDFDVDFADTRRDEVLAYIRERYGEDHVAQIITFGTMAARAAVRDAGRALGLSYGLCDRVAKLIPFNATIEDAIKKAPELKEMYGGDENTRKVLDAAKHLEGVARHASVHACGTVVAGEPLENIVPLQLSPQDKDVVITQFEFHAIEDLGLLKIDILGLKNMTIIEETVRLVEEMRGAKIDISNIPLNDEKTFTLFKAADTGGVFQFESSGMRRYMKELQPTKLEDLVALVALYRPGPMELIPTFIKRKLGKEKVTYLHPRLEPILKDTYGIGVYQEQMMRIARDLAGYSLPEADTLRKAIGKKIKSLLDKQKEKLIKGMVENGIDPTTARAIWNLFPPFARYGFNRSHAVCYALIAYRTAYLKAHYREEFMASLLNADRHDTDRIAVLVHEAQQAQIDITPPDVNKSFATFAPEGKKIRFGLTAIKNVGEAIAEAIVEERVARGPFGHLEDFLERVDHKDLNKKSLESLIKAGALDSLGIERGKLLAGIDDLVRFNTRLKKSKEHMQNSLFGEQGLPANGMTLTLADAPATEARQKAMWEKELLGFYLSGHPLKAHAETLKKWGVQPISKVREIRNGEGSVKIAGVVTRVQHVLTKTGQPMCFVRLEDHSPKPLEVIVFNNVLEKTRDVWKENTVVAVRGRISWRGDEPKLVADNAKALASADNPKQE